LSEDYAEDWRPARHTIEQEVKVRWGPAIVDNRGYEWTATSITVWVTWAVGVAAAQTNVRWSVKTRRNDERRTFHHDYFQAVPDWICSILTRATPINARA
jgi:hypothetical protein